MLLTLLSISPLLAIVWITAIITALTVHEFAHALVGKLLGDDTAEAQGRLTLNPLAHVDPMGFFFLLFVGFGWAKPVPYDPRQLKHPLRDALLIALAGPFSNLVIAVVAGLIFRFAVLGGAIPETSFLTLFLFLLIIINCLLAIFNLLPLYPLDGSKLVDIFLSGPRFFSFRLALMRYGPMVLFALVLASQFGGVDIFGFLYHPAYFICDTTIGQSCDLWYARLLSF